MVKLNNRKHLTLALIILLFAIVGWGLLPYFEAIFAALVFAPILTPLYLWFVRLVKREHLAAGLTILTVLLLIIVPLFFAAGMLVREAGVVYNQYTHATETPGRILFGVDPKEMTLGLIRDGIVKLKGSLANILSQIADLLVNLFITFFLLFYLLRYGKHAEQLIKRWLPFTDKHDWEIIANFKRVARGFVIGQGLTAIAQGIIGTIGFLIFGVQGALFFGFVMALFALIPMVGTAIVWVPLGLLQLLLGNTLAGIGVLAWGLLITSNIDNFVQPLIMKNMVGVHPVVTILGIFSGLAVFGLIGFVIGPLLLTLAIESAKMFREEWYG